MKLQKVTTDKALDAVLGTVEAGIGFAASNAAVGPVNSLVKNKMASRGLVAVTGLALAIAVPNKHVKAIGGGVAAKQIWELGKEALSPMVPQTGMMAEALDKLGYSSMPSSTVAAALNARRRGRRSLGNPTFKLGNPMAATSNGFIAG